VEEGACATYAGVNVVQDGVVDHAYKGDALVEQALRDAGVGEAVHEVDAVCAERVRFQSQSRRKFL
jgi:hypothetical protein